MQGKTNAAFVEDVQGPGSSAPENIGKTKPSGGDLFDYASAAVGIVGGVTWVVLSASATDPVGLTVGLGLGAAGFFGGCLALLSKLSSGNEAKKRGR